MVTPYPPIFGTPFRLVYAYLETLLWNYWDGLWTHCLAWLFWDQKFENWITLRSQNKDFIKSIFFEISGSKSIFSCAQVYSRDKLHQTSSRTWSSTILHSNKAFRRHRNITQLYISQNSWDSNLSFVMQLGLRSIEHPFLNIFWPYWASIL